MSCPPRPRNGCSRKSIVRWVRASSHIETLFGPARGVAFKRRRKKFQFRQSQIDEFNRCFQYSGVYKEIKKELCCPYRPRVLKSLSIVSLVNYYLDSLIEFDLFFQLKGSKSPRKSHDCFSFSWRRVPNDPN